MNKIIKFSILLLALSLTANVGAQTKAEINQYNKTIAKPSVAAFDKFLKKYPNSVYAEDIIERKDTLLNISPLSIEEAEVISSSFISEGSQYASYPLREEGIDRIYTIAVSGPDVEYHSYQVLTLEKEVKKKETLWTIKDTQSISTLLEYEDFASIDLLEESSIKSLSNRKLLFFNYQIKSPSNSTHRCFVYACYSPQTNEFTEISFEGTLQQTKDNVEIIEGVTNEKLYGQARSEVALLLAQIDNNPSFKKIPEEVQISDFAVQWWLDNNPQAMSDAKKINMSILPLEASLIPIFESAKKSSSKNYSAAIIDVRGWTLVVVKQKSDNSYLLAWAEPECKDHYKDRLLNSLSFTDTNSLKMSYYHGRKTFSYTLNLSSKAITR